MLVTRRDIRVEWGDCDPADIVYFPNYFKWFDNNMMQHFENAGTSKKEVLKTYDLVGIPLVDIRGQFHKPSAYGDIVTIETKIAKWGRTSMDIEHKLMRADGTVAVEGFEKRVFVGRDPADPKKLKSVPVPQELIKLFDGAAPGQS